MKKLINNICALLAVFMVTVIIMCSCSSDMEESTARDEAKHYISFTPMEIGTRSMTRGTQTTLSTLTSYGVSCSTYASDESYTSAESGSYFYNKEIDASTGETGYLWPGADRKVSFFAYAPYGNSALTISSANTIGRPTYTYTVPASISSQVDFITAEVLDHVGGLITDPVTLSFSHRCTDIKLSVYNRGEESITIHSISVYGVKYTGYYSTGWSLDDAVSTSSSHAFTLTPASGTVAAKATVDMTGTVNHIIMLPQTVAGGTDFIAVDATIGGERKTLGYTLPEDLTLEEGKSYTMTISFGPQYIDVDTSSDIEDWEVETKYLTVESVSTNGTLSQPGVNTGTVTGVDDWTEE